MITEKEILQGNKLPDNLKKNMDVLFLRLNRLRNAYGLPMLVSSGLRSLTYHLHIYRMKGIDNPPLKSLHLTCEACDFHDPEGYLKHFILNNIRLMEEIGLWFEDFTYTDGWVHMQTRPPGSGKRFFIP